MKKLKLTLRIIRNLVIGLFITFSGSVGIGFFCYKLIPSDTSLTIAFVISFMFVLLTAGIIQDVLNTGDLITDLLDEFNI